jgi:hypothetical protein
VNSVTQTDPSNFTKTLTQAAIADLDKNRRPDSASMVAALLTAEKTAKQERLDLSFESLLGEWRLCFATSGKPAKTSSGIVLGKGYYFPQFTPASITFAQNANELTTGTVTNQLQLGGLQLKFIGPCRYPGKKNLLVFDFTELHIYLWGRKLYQTKIRSGKKNGGDFATTPIGKLPFFAFFWATPDGIAARGKGGGLALWIKKN